MVAAQSRGCGSSSEGLYAHISADQEAERRPPVLILFPNFYLVWDHSTWQGATHIQGRSITF